MDSKYQEFDVNVIEVKSDKSRKTSSIGIGVALLILLLVVIVVSSAIGIGVALYHENDELAGLHVKNITQQEVKGEYYGEDGGIFFQSNVNDTYFVLTITTTSGEPIVFIIHPIELNMTVMSVNYTNFMIMENQPGRPKYDDYIVPESSMNRTMSIMMGVGEMSDKILQQFDNSTVNETRQSVLHTLAMSEEAILVIKAAQALGDLGVQGSDYPAAMRFYLFALRLAYARGDNVGSNSGGTVKSTELERKRQLQYCRNNGATCRRRRCPIGSECFGMCGYSCFCWSFVCGDCCVHQYCRSHDQCCADRGFFSFACLSVAWRVLGSQCTQTYDC